MAEEKEFFVDVVLPLSLGGYFTYHTEEALFHKIQPGMRVAVSFGGRKIYAAIVERKHKKKPSLSKTKQVLACLDEFPIVTETQRKFFNWIAAYYMTPIGDVYRTALPSGFFLQSDTFIHAKAAVIPSNKEITDEEFIVLEALTIKKVLLLKEISSILDSQKIMPVVKSLFDKGLIELEEKAQEKYKPKEEKYVSLPDDIKYSELEATLKELQKAPKQREALLLIFSELGSKKNAFLPLSHFIQNKNIASQTLKQLENKNLIYIHTKIKNRINTTPLQKTDLKLNTPLHEVIVHTSDNTKINVLILNSLHEKNSFLKSVIKEKNGTLLILMKDFNDVVQMYQHLKEETAGVSYGVFNPKFNTHEKVDFWKSVQENRFDVIIGTRPVLFYPFKNLDLIFMDNEQDVSYKQSHHKPYYNARDLAVMLTEFYSTKVILSSSTPSAESFYNTEKNKYGIIHTIEKDKSLSFELEDISIAYKKNKMKGDFSIKLLDEIKTKLADGKKILIYKDRRGYSTQLECKTCGYVAYCVNCDVSLTYHKYMHELKCHYCGSKQAVYTKCPACHSHDLTTKGVGTQQIEEQLKTFFPEAKIRRMDADTMRRKFAQEKLTEDFQAGEIDILVGTRMVLSHWSHVPIGLISIVKADELLHFPDFRSTERAYQLINHAQVLAKSFSASLFIQTHQPAHPVFSFLKEDYYTGFIREVLASRESFSYPPYTRLILISLSHRNKERLITAASHLGQLLRSNLDDRSVLGPESPVTERINNEYYRQILIKIYPGQSPAKIKHFIQKCVNTLYNISAYKSINLKIDVDPQKS